MAGDWSDLVFVSEAGTPLIPSNLRRLISDLSAAAGIEGTRMVHHHYRHPVTPSISVARDHVEEALG